MRPPPPPYPSTAVSSKQRAGLEATQMDTSGAAGLVSGTNVPATTKQLPVISTAKVVTNRDALSAKMQQRNFATQVHNMHVAFSK